MTIPIWLLAAHFIGDFLLQSNWMALNKSKDSEVLAIHCLVYSLCFAPWGVAFVIVTFWLHFLTDFYTSRLTSKLWFIPLRPAAYVGTEDDVLRMAGSDRLPDHKGNFDIFARLEGTVPNSDGPNICWLDARSETKRHWFFVAIGFDQLIHFVTLALTYRWLVG